jgi:hypothetical protein
MKSGALLRCEQIDASSLADEAGRLDEIYDGELCALVVHNVFEGDWMAEVAARLQEPERSFAPSLHGKNFDQPTLCTIGTPISRFDANSYFDAAVEFHEGCTRLFENGPPYGERVYDVLSALGGASVRRATSASGRVFPGWNLRILPPGAASAEHQGRLFFDWPGYAELGACFDRATQLSFYVVIAAPESGGALEIRSNEENEDIDSLLLSLAPGEMIVFDEGRYPHRVTAVEGNRRRITLGGFLGRDTRESGWLNWA